MKKIILGGALCALLVTGCTILTGKNAGNLALPSVIEEAIADTSTIAGDAQINAVIKEGVKWVDGSISTYSGGGVGLAGILYLARMLFRQRKKLVIQDESMDSNAKAKAKELAKHTSVEKDFA